MLEAEFSDTENRTVGEWKNMDEESKALVNRKRSVFSSSLKTLESLNLIQPFLRNPMAQLDFAEDLSTVKEILLNYFERLDDPSITGGLHTKLLALV